MSIRVVHFSDVLCVWAYVAQARMDQLAVDFGDEVAVEYRFCSVFGNAREKLEKSWRERGGLDGFSAHLRGVVAQFPHVEVHPRPWLESAPRSSLAAHVFLTAIRVLEGRGELEPGASPRAAWATRLAFFREARDVSVRDVQLRIAEGLGFGRAPIEACLDDGTAHAALSSDYDAARELDIKVSPTLVLNEGRQHLNGNVGYRVIEANVRELLRSPSVDSASWC